MLSGGLPEDLRGQEEAARLRNVLKQALSRNKAHEKIALWKQKTVEDHGSEFTLSLKSNDGGVVRTVPLISSDAQVTETSVNKYEEDRRRVAEKKEDLLLDRLCDGKDSAWRPDSFFTDALGEDDLPWRMKPSDLFTNPVMVQRVVCAYEASRCISKKEKKKDKKKEKKDKERGKKSKKKEGKDKAKDKDKDKDKKKKRKKKKKKGKDKKDSQKKKHQESESGSESVDSSDAESAESLTFVSAEVADDVSSGGKRQRLEAAKSEAETLSDARDPSSAASSDSEPEAPSSPQEGELLGSNDSSSPREDSEPCEPDAKATLRPRSASRSRDAQPGPGVLHRVSLSSEEDEPPAQKPRHERKKKRRKDER